MCVCVIGMCLNIVYECVLCIVCVYEYYLIGISECNCGFECVYVCILCDV